MVLPEPGCHYNRHEQSVFESESGLQRLPVTEDFVQNLLIEGEVAIELLQAHQIVWVWSPCWLLNRLWLEAVIEVFEVHVIVIFIVTKQLILLSEKLICLHQSF